MTNHSVLHHIRILAFTWWWLTFRAEVGAPIAYNYPLNGSATVRAGFSAAVGNLKLEMGCSQCAIGAEVVCHTGSFITNR